MTATTQPATPAIERAGLLDRALRLFADVRAGEGGTALLLTLNVFLLLAAYYCIKPVREALILAGERDPEKLAALIPRLYDVQAGRVLVDGIDVRGDHVELRLGELQAQRGTTLVFISHDRYFINRIATQVVEVDRGRLTTHLGNYDDYLARKAQPEAALAVTLRMPEVGTAAQPAAKHSQKKVQPPRKALDREIKAIKTRLQAVEMQISTMERRLEEISLSLADPDLYRDGERARQIAQARKDAEGQVAWLMKEWEELSLQLAAATGGA